MLMLYWGGRLLELYSTLPICSCCIGGVDCWNYTAHCLYAHVVLGGGGVDCWNYTAHCLHAHVVLGGGGSTVGTIQHTAYMLMLYWGGGGGSTVRTIQHTAYMLMLYWGGGGGGRLLELYSTLPTCSCCIGGVDCWNYTAHCLHALVWNKRFHCLIYVTIKKRLA